MLFRIAFSSDLLISLGVLCKELLIFCPSHFNYNRVCHDFTATYFLLGLQQEKETGEEQVSCHGSQKSYIKPHYHLFFIILIFKKTNINMF